MKSQRRKEYDPFSGDQVKTETIRRRLRTANQVIYLALAAQLANNVEQISGYTVQAEIPEQLKSPIDVTPVEPDVFDDLTVIRIDNPDDRFVTRDTAHHETIVQFRQATNIIAEASDGAIHTASEIHAIKFEEVPEGRVYPKQGEPYGCYPVDQLKDIKQRVVERNDIPDDAMIAISLESAGAKTCQARNAVAYVGAPVSAGGGVYHDGILRNDENGQPVPVGASIESTIILHEIGHSVGLNHVGEIRLPDNTEYPSENTDIAIWAKSGAQYVGLEEEANKKSSIDMYASNRTVMGSLHSTSEDNIPYTFIERQRLNPAGNSVEVIEAPVAVDVPISLDGPKRGIRLPTQDNHPLMSIKDGAPLKSVEIGIDFLYGHADYATINTYITNDKDESFEVSLSGSNQIFGKDKPELHTDLTELYRDTDLGLTVSVVRENDNYREAVLQVRPIANEK